MYGSRIFAIFWGKYINFQEINSVVDKFPRAWEGWCITAHSQVFVGFLLKYKSNIIYNICSILI